MMTPVIDQRNDTMIAFDAYPSQINETAGPHRSKYSL